jgi:hypothetical protein
MIGGWRVIVAGCADRSWRPDWRAPFWRCVERLSIGLEAEDAILADVLRAFQKYRWSMVGATGIEPVTPTV